MNRTKATLSMFCVAGFLAACGGEIIVGGGSGGDTSESDAGGSTSSMYDASTSFEDGSESALGYDAGPDGGPPVYALTAQTTGSTPLANGCGITYDGSELWILASAGAPQPYTLARFDAATSTIDRSFSLASLFATKGTGAFGIAWDGSSIWVSVSGDSNALAQINPTTGAILKSISSPTELGPSDLDFDGTDLWLSSGTGDAYRLTTPSGAQAEHFSLPLGSSRDYGIAFRSGELFIGQLFGGVEIYNPSSGAMIGSAVHPDGTAFTQEEVGPSVFVGDNLVMLSSAGLTTYAITTYVP